MSDEAEREAEPEVLSDGDIYIEDMPEFLERFDAIACQNKDGQLFVLRKDTLNWVNVETSVKRGPRSAK
jgi:hypothetical protein